MKSHDSKKNLPKYVTFKHGAYYYRPNSRTWEHLGRTESNMYIALAAIKSGSTKTMIGYIEDYHKEVTPTKAVTTQKVELPCIINLKKSFGAMLPNEIKAHDVYNYHQARAATSPASANREKSLLSSIMGRLMLQGLCKSNPCVGVPKAAIAPRRRYVTDEEFEHIKSLAPPEIKAAMDIAFLTGLRMGDILRLTHENIQDTGIHTPTSKSKRNMIYAWSNALIDAVAFAQSVNHGSTYLIANTKGQKYTESAFKSRWGKMMRKLVAERGIARFQFKDLRKKAGSDTVGDATEFLSHSSDAVTKAHYLVKPWAVKPTR